MESANDLLQIEVVGNPDLAAVIHTILAAAFSRFKHLYTEEAYYTTVASEETIAHRIQDQHVTVLLALYEGQVVGTLSFKITHPGEMYFFSMGVDPAYAGKGIGNALLRVMEKNAVGHGCKRISLETYTPLKSAIHLYEKNGYLSTGRVRDYGGIEIFEMEKML